MPAFNAVKLDLQSYFADPLGYADCALWRIKAAVRIAVRAKMIAVFSKMLCGPALADSAIARYSRSLRFLEKWAILENQPEVVTTINVKGVSLPEWDRARRAARAAGESMGTWLTRAIRQLADMEEGPREFPPDNPADKKIRESGNPPMSGEALAAVIESVASLAAATGVKPPVTTVRQLYAAADDIARDQRGVARRPLRAVKPPAKLLIEAGNPANPGGAPKAW